MTLGRVLMVTATGFSSASSHLVVPADAVMVGESGLVVGQLVPLEQLRVKSLPVLSVDGRQGQAGWE